MKRALLLCLTISLVGVTALAEESDPDPMEILKHVDAAIKAVDSVRMTIVSTPSGAATNFASAAEGEAIIVGWDGARPEYFYTHVKTTRRGSEEEIELTGGGNGDTFFVIDHGTRKGYEDMDPAVMGSSGNAVGRLGMIEYVHDAPFDDELGADELEYLGRETIGGVDCHTINVVYSGGRGRSTWYFSTEDYLPRRRDQHISGQAGEGTISIVITELEVNPKIDQDLFVMKLPEGYEQIDDFAP